MEGVTLKHVPAGFVKSVPSLGSSLNSPFHQGDLSSWIFQGYSTQHWLCNRLTPLFSCGWFRNSLLVYLGNLKVKDTFGKEAWVVTWLLDSTFILALQNFVSFQDCFVILCVGCFAHMCAHTTCVLGAYGGQVSHSLDLELQMLWATGRGYWELNSGPLEEEQGLLTSEQLIQPQDFFLAITPEIRVLLFISAMHGKIVSISLIFDYLIFLLKNFFCNLVRRSL